MKKLVAAAVTTFLFGCAQSPLPSVSRVEDSPDNVLFRDVSVFDGEGCFDTRTSSWWAGRSRR